VQTDKMPQVLAGSFLEGLVDLNGHTRQFPCRALRGTRQQRLESVIPQAEYDNPDFELI
jgi:hypothetical protein